MMRIHLLALSLLAGVTFTPAAAHEGCELADTCPDAASAPRQRIAQAAPPVVRPMPGRPPALPPPPTITSRPVQPAPKVRAPVVVPLTQPVTGQGINQATSQGTKPPTDPAKQKQAQPAKREYPGAIRARYQQILLGRDFDSEIVTWTRLIGLNPDAASYMHRGNVHRFKGDYKLALADYNKAITLNPRLSEAFNNRGLCLLWSGDFDRAVADFDRALVIEPGHPTAQRNRQDAVAAKQSPASLESAFRPP